jgi:hypothetical protein
MQVASNQAALAKRNTDALVGAAHPGGSLPRASYPQRCRCEPNPIKVGHPLHHPQSTDQRSNRPDAS